MMTLKDAAAALAADPSALFFAGRDFDQLAVSLAGDHEFACKISDLRASFAGLDAPARLVRVREGIATLVDTVAAKEKARADAEAWRVENRREIARIENERRIAQECAERTHRAANPLLCALKSQVDAFQNAVLAARTAADFDAAGEALVAAVVGAQVALAAIAKVLLKLEAEDDAHAAA